MRGMALAGALTVAVCAGPVFAEDAPQEDERLWSCETSLAGERVEVNYLRDAAFHENVGRLEKNLSGWGRVSCPGFVSLREILRRVELQTTSARGERRRLKHVIFVPHRGARIRIRSRRTAPARPK